MRTIINMPEGDINEPQMPPKPLLYSTHPMPIVGDSETDIGLETFSQSPSAPLFAPASQFD